MENAHSSDASEAALRGTPPAFLLRPDRAPTPLVVEQAPPPADAEESPTTLGEGDDESAAAAKQPAVMALLDAVDAAQAPHDLPLVVEALLLAAEEPPTVSQLAQATFSPPDAVEAALETLEQASSDRGLRLQRDGARVRLVTAPEAAPFVQRLLGLERPNRLSKAALETLAIVAYQQPVTRGTIERVRGVSCDAPIATLRARELIASAGQMDSPGRPHLWGTTAGFLEHFSLRGLDELPALAELPPPAAQSRLSLDEDTQDLETAAPDAGAAAAALRAPALDPAPTDPAPRRPVPTLLPAPADLGGLAAAGGD